MRDFFTFALRLCFRECETMNKCNEGKNCDHRPISIKYEKKVPVKLHLSSLML